MPQAFEGFRPSFFKFFKDLSRNNERAWFEANKPRFRQDVQIPLSTFVEAMAPRLARISKHYVADPRLNGGSIFRIHKDMRFAKGGKPYKEHGACQFRHALGKDVHAPGFYVHLAPGEVVFGGGVWKPASPELRKIRDEIARPRSGWPAVVGDKKLMACYGGVSGDGLSRAPKGFDPEHPLIDDLKRQSFFAMRHEKAKLTQSPDFIDEVEVAFKAAAPLLRFLCKAIDVPF